MSNAVISGAMGANRNPHNVLVNSDGFVGFGIPIYIDASGGAQNLNVAGQNYAVIFANSAAVVTITSSLYNTDGVGATPASVPIPEGSYYVVPGATELNFASGKVTVYKSIIHDS